MASIYAEVGEQSQVSVTTDEDVSATAVAVTIETGDKTDVATIADGSLTKTSSSVAFSLSSSVTASERTLRFAVRKTADSAVVASGKIYVTYDAKGDS